MRCGVPLKLFEKAPFTLDSNDAISVRVMAENDNGLGDPSPLNARGTNLPQRVVMSKLRMTDM